MHKLYESMLCESISCCSDTSVLFFLIFIFFFWVLYFFLYFGLFCSFSDPSKESRQTDWLSIWNGRTKNEYALCWVVHNISRSLWTLSLSHTHTCNSTSKRSGKKINICLWMYINYITWTWTWTVQFVATPQNDQ